MKVAKEKIETIENNLFIAKPDYKFVDLEEKILPCTDNLAVDVKN